jgi:hypothetical protein
MKIWQAMQKVRAGSSELKSISMAMTSRSSSAALAC